MGLLSKAYAVDICHSAFARKRLLGIRRWGGATRFRYCATLRWNVARGHESLVVRTICLTIDRNPAMTPIDPNTILPLDHAEATLAGRVFRPDVGGASVVAPRPGGGVGHLQTLPPHTPA